MSEGDKLFKDLGYMIQENPFEYCYLKYDKQNYSHSIFIAKNLKIVGLLGKESLSYNEVKALAMKIEEIEKEG